MSDVNFDGFVRMTWARFATLIIAICGFGFMGIKKLNDIDHRLDNSVTVKQMNRWERQFKNDNPSLRIPSINDFDSTAISQNQNGLSAVR